VEGEADIEAGEGVEEVGGEVVEEAGMWQGQVVRRRLMWHGSGKKPTRVPERTTIGETRERGRWLEVDFPGSGIIMGS
jgi:hypothetical protein